MRRTMWMTVLAGGLLAAVAGPLAAGEMHGHFGHGEHGEHGYLGFLQGVSLTADQTAQVHSIIKADMQQSKPQWQQLRALRDQISGELASTGTINPATLAAQQQQVETLQSQLDQARLSAALQVRQLLSADQLSQAATVHSQLAALHQQERAVMRGASASPASASPATASPATP